MVEDAAFGVQQAGEPRVVHLDGAHLLDQGLHGDVHSDYPYQRARAVDRHEVGADQQIVLEPRPIGPNPRGAPARDRRVVPSGVLRVVRVELPDVDRLPLGETGFPRAGVEEPVLRVADIGVDAIEVRHDAGRVAGHDGGDFQDPLTVLREVGIQPFRLLGGPLPRYRSWAHHAAPHQLDAVQRIAREVTDELHGLLDAARVGLQGQLGVVGDQVHRLN